MRKHTTYLVGTYRRYTQYLSEHGFSELSVAGYVMPVQTLADLKDVPMGSRFLFLRDWEQLEEHNQIHSWVVVRQTLERMIREAEEEAGS